MNGKNIGLKVQYFENRCLYFVSDQSNIGLKTIGLLINYRYKFLECVFKVQALKVNIYAVVIFSLTSKLPKFEEHSQEVMFSVTVNFVSA